MFLLCIANTEYKIPSLSAAGENVEAINTPCLPMQNSSIGNASQALPTGRP